MRLVLALLAIAITVVFLSSAMAVPPGKTVEYAGGPMGKVVFDGKVHADKGLKCNDCHTKIFQMKKTAKIVMADHEAGKQCFECHNGTKAFAPKDNCTKCHKK